jgi:calcineurin-like phosphoesterase family protein
LITMCHYSMAAWDQSHRGSIQLYGHSHSTDEDRLDIIMPGRRSMDVGVDNAFKRVGEFRPFCIETEIIPWMLARPGTRKTQVDGPTEAELLS